MKLWHIIGISVCSFTGGLLLGIVTRKPPEAVIEERIVEKIIEVTNYTRIQDTLAEALKNYSSNTETKANESVEIIKEKITSSDGSVVERETQNINKQIEEKVITEVVEVEVIKEVIKEAEQIVITKDVVKTEYINSIPQKHMLGVGLSVVPVEFRLSSIAIDYSYRVLSSGWLGVFAEIPLDYKNINNYKVGIMFSISF